MKKRCILALLCFPLISFSQFNQVGIDICGDEFDFSGFSTDLNDDGKFIVIGQPGNNSQGSFTGRVRVYEDVNSTWTQVGQDLFGSATNDFFGNDVSISDNGMKIAVADVSNANGVDAGIVRVYEFNGTTWNQVGQDIVGTASGDGNESEISLSGNGNTIVIGYPSNDEAGFFAGKVRVFENIGGTWTQKGSSILGTTPDDQLGASVDISGSDYIAIGSPGGLSPNPSGKVLLYNFVGGNWNLTTTILGIQPNENFGTSLAISVDAGEIIVGAPDYEFNGIQIGQVRVYSNSGVQLGQSIDPLTTNVSSSNNITFGGRHTVGISQFGDVVVVGEKFNQSVSANDGVVRAFKFVQNQWIQISQDLIGSADEALYVAISRDGNRIGQSSQTNDQKGTNSGLTKIFELCVDISVTQNGNMLTSNQSNGTYQWIDCDNGNAPIPGATSQTFTPNQSGNYAVIVDANGCSATSECVEFTLVGVNELKPYNLMIYPNPSTIGIITIEHDIENSVQVYVTDVLGRVVFEADDVNNVLELKLENGNYFVSISSENILVTTKVIILK